jgi:DNA topoisomerase-1
MTTKILIRTDIEMQKSLIIVESPSKAKTVKKYLGKDYFVEASVGHIKNLPKSKISVDIEAGYVPTFELIKGKEDVVKKLSGMSSRADKIFIATDPDREGEAIAYDIAEEVEKKNDNIYRVLFHEITQSGIAEAMQKPKKIDRHLVDSQRARRVMDRIVGYKISPFIWKTVYYGLSAGRVQSVALRLICEREDDIQQFVKEEYWSITGEFKTAKSEPFFAKLVQVEKKDPRIPDEVTVNGYVSNIKNYSYAISNVQKKVVKCNPPPPFITSTLQQEAAARLGFPAKKTMSLAQKLYEGIEIGEDGLVGLITYMRTDSTRLSKDSIDAVRNFIYENYGGDYLPKEPRQFKKGKSTQDAHEAIRPTTIKYNPKAIKKYFDKKELFDLYELIWNRFIACQMAPAEFDQMTVEISGGEYLFRATGTSPKFRGFLQVYDDIKEENGTNGDGDPTSKIPSHLHIGESASLLDVIPRQHFTKPPGRYTESSLVKDLEAYGIGRPSTYAQIVSTIIDRKYVEQTDKKLYALPLGMTVNHLLTQNFPEIFNVQFTAQMEEELDMIALGKRTYKKVMDDFYHPFIHALEKVDKKTSEIKKTMVKATDESCELCGKSMVIKWGRNGRFKACTGYPACKNTKPLDQDVTRHEHLENLKCEKCGGDMIMRSSRFGSFLGCSNYPNCTNTQPISMAMKCPKCKEGNIIERQTKRKRIFYGCSWYPECDFASWAKPIDQACEVCSSSYMVEKSSQKLGTYLECPNCKAKVNPIQQEAEAV